MNGKRRLTSALEQVLLNYSWAIDSKDWQLLAECFTANCTVSYGNGNSPHPGGGPKVFGNRDELVTYLRQTHEPLDASLHMISNVDLIHLSRKTARSRCYARNLLVSKNHPGGSKYESAGYYSDRLVREAGAWRIDARSYTRIWADGNARIIQGSTQAP
jgi:hypothetical protein